ATLRGFSAIVEDWSQYDCDGAIAWMRTRYPAAQLTGVAHSVGALLFGGADHSAELARYAFIGPHTGYWRDYRPRHRLPMALLWHGVMPALTRAWGYFPASWLGLGDDIPAGIALQWAARRTPQVDPSALGHSADEARQRRVLARFREGRGS